MVQRSILAAALALCALLVSSPSAACTLSISVDCSSGTCVSDTTNTSTQSCSGQIYSMFWSPDGSPVQFHNATTNGFLSTCYDSSIFPDPSTYPYAICFSDASRSMSPSGSFEMRAGVSGDVSAVEAISVVINPTTGELIAYAVTSDVIETPTCTPVIASPGAVQSGIAYRAVWSAVNQAGASYEIQESTSPNFTTGVTTRTTSELFSEFIHFVEAPTTYYYRVRAVSCGGVPGEFSSVSRTLVIPQADPTSARFDLVAPLGTTTPLEQQIFIPNPGGVSAFAVSVDQPWLTVTPSSGPFPESGLILSIRAVPTGFPVGATSATITVTYTAASGKEAMGTTPTTVPVSVTLVTPVSSGGKSAPPANAMVIPAVAHVSGGAHFQSDVRISNTNPTEIDYELFFTPSNSNGLEQGRMTTIRLSPGQTAALNDIVKNFFGFAGEGEQAGGSLEIRPLRTSAASTRATSRTYSLNSAGTLGQFIPGVPLRDFIGVPDVTPIPGAPIETAGVISLQQVSQSASASTGFRTNLGLVEGAGETASGTIRVFNAAGQQVHQESFTLQPAEHRQINQYLAARGIILDEARIEVVTTSATGKVTSYASVIDNITQDPFLVPPVRVDRVASRRYVLPGVAAVSSAFSNFYSDVRIYNAGSSTTSATLRYVPRGAAEVVRQIDIAPGQIVPYDNIIETLFQAAGTGGALLIDTPAETSLVVTGRTYSRAAEGTYGQFIPAITSSDGTGAGEGALQILQIEQSPEFRTNVGLVELTGKTATVRLSTSLPDSRVAPFVDVTLQPNEFRQFDQFIARSLNLGTSYNTRVSVQVIGGEGRVAAYASVVDMKTSDPTYVPAR